jgi:hypothetical protein
MFWDLLFYIFLDKLDQKNLKSANFQNLEVLFSIQWAIDVP